MSFAHRGLRRRTMECVVIEAAEYVEAPHAAVYNYDTGDAFTLLGWFRFDTVSGNRGLIEKSNPFGGANDGKGWGLNIEAGELHTRMDHDDVTDGITKTTDGLGLVVDTWYHLGLTYDGSNDEAGVTFWINGAAWTGTENVIVNTLVASDTIANSQPLQFGARSLVGYMDEVAVFSGEATASDFTKLYNGGAVVDYSSLSLSVTMDGYWRMAEGSAFPTIPDETANGNDATMVNMEARDRVPRP